MNSKTAERSSARVAHPFFGASWSKSSLVRVAKNVSATALSKHEPTAPIDCAIPASWQAWPNSRPMNCPPWSEWWIVPFGGRRRRTAICSASTTSSERMWLAIAQPTIRRE